MSAVGSGTLAAVAPDARGFRRIRRYDLGGLILSVVALVAALAWAFPIYWTVVATTVPDAGMASRRSSTRSTSIAAWSLKPTSDVGTSIRW